MDVLIAKRTCTDEVGTTYELEYRLVTESNCYNGKTCKDYGICICGNGVDTVRIPSITINRQTIDELMRLLIRNCVFPISLPDILQDVL